MVEVLRSTTDRLEARKKRAFVQEAITIFQEVIGTPPGRLRIFILEIPLDEDRGETVTDDGSDS
jgi:phenylpyruvate tautomerase PptA (4-oxalocrotonate tautomerase family)